VVVAADVAAVAVADPAAEQAPEQAFAFVEMLEQVDSICGSWQSP
jgi:hypothetical protein